jgi:Tol biopolymer transport system component
LTADPNYESTYPDISGDGNKIVWFSKADFVGLNPGHKTQIFLYDATTGTKRQLTSSQGDVLDVPPRISRDGAWVYFSQNGLTRVSVATGVAQHVSGFGHNTSPFTGYFDVDSGATHTVLTGQDIIDRSPSAYSVFLADQTVTPKIAVGKAAPTLVTWDPEPDAIRYDVIRGDVADLKIVGSTVNLGPVTCIEDDSPDNHTRGFEDIAQPAPSQVLFYLYRGTTGPSALTGTWGQGTGNKERVAGAGSCNP